MIKIIYKNSFNKKARQDVGLFRIWCLGITPVVPHVLVSHLSLLFYGLEHPALYVHHKKIRRDDIDAMVPNSCQPELTVRIKHQVRPIGIVDAA